MKDYAAQGRLRRLAIAVLGPLPMFLVPVLLVATMGDELPERVRVHGWSFATRVEFTWQAWSAQPVWGAAGVGGGAVGAGVPVVLACAVGGSGWWRRWAW
ncbi:hypothetical protein [Nonomuraea salmonea]|uniref:hypothetical protein n=1 Tax=Nonomuraea salmonea TaxID=46181 RepID=UPI002FE73B34